MENWKRRNPAADRKLWDEQRSWRGRAMVWLIGVPFLLLVVGTTSFAFAGSGKHIDLDFGPVFASQTTPNPITPAYVRVTTPAAPVSAPTSEPAPVRPAKPSRPAHTK